MKDRRKTGPRSIATLWPAWRGELRALLIFLACLAYVPASWSLDTEAQFDFKIGPQKLSTALVEFSRQANAQLVSDTTEVDRFDSAGVTGRMTMKNALRALLQGTDLEFRVTEHGVIAIRAFPRNVSLRGGF